MHGKGYISFERMPWKICKRFLHPGTLLKEPLAQVFSCEFSEISKNTFFTDHVWSTAS